MRILPDDKWENWVWEKLASGSQAVSGPVSHIREAVELGLKPSLSPNLSAAWTWYGSNQEYNFLFTVQRVAWAEALVTGQLYLICLFTQTGLTMHWSRDSSLWYLTRLNVLLKMFIEQMGTMFLYVQKRGCVRRQGTMVSEGCVPLTHTLF